MSEQKRLDRPDREKAIREILDGITTSRQYGYITTEDKEKAADKIIALFPDIDKDELIVEMRREYEQKLTLKEKVVTERVEKQERERIINKLEQCMAGLAIDHPEYYERQEFIVMPAKYWQALKSA